MKTTIIAIALMLSSASYSQCTDVTLTLTDSYGDTWNGGSLTIDGVDYDGIGLWVPGNGTESVTYDLCFDLSGCIDVIYTAGSYSYENSWSIALASDGTELTSGADNSNTFGYGCIGTPAPANDNCTDAILLECGDSETGTTFNATASGFGGSSTNSGEDVWYSFIGTGTEATVSLCGSSFDTYLRVYDACAGNQVAANDDNFTACGTSSSQLTMPTTAGAEYKISVGGYGIAQGDFAISLTCAEPCTNTYSIDVQEACDSFTWVDGNTYTASTDQVEWTTTNAAGCDSIILLDLTINNSTTSIDVVTACGEYTWIDGITYTASNDTTTYTTTNAAGCDSIVTLDLTINDNVYTQESVTDCFEVVFGDSTYTEDTQFVLELAMTNGCTEFLTVYIDVQDCAGIEEEEITIGQGPFKVYNTMGQLIPTDNLPKNVMLIKVYANGVSEKFVVVK